MAQVHRIKKGKISDKTLSLIVQRIRKSVDPEKVVLFGSQASGRASRGSDVDLLIVKSGKIKSRASVAAAAYGSLEGIMVPKDIVVCTEEEIKEWSAVPQSFLTNAVNTGRVVYEKH